MKSTQSCSTCTSCPSFLVGREQTRTLLTNFNGPVCGRRMLPLVMPNQDEDAKGRVLTHMARTCEYAGQEVQLDTLRADASPNINVGMATNVPTPDPQQSTADCRTCVNYINPVQTQRKTGWTGAICRANGTLIIDGLFRNYAKTCGQYTRQIGARSLGDPFSEFTFSPTFADTFGRVDPTAAYNKSLESFVDPSDYPTDRTVTERMRQRGIRAWRKIEDPSGYGQPVYLPIYSQNLFTEEERELIPRAGDDEHPELYADFNGSLYHTTVMWMKLDETPALWGMGGTGKTEFVRFISWLMCAPFHRINITNSSEIDDLAGKIVFEEGETRPHYGRLPKAWMRPGVILLDEPNTGPPDIWQLIRPLTDNSRTLVLDMLKGERIKRHTDCFLAMAMNPAWDPRNTGTQTLGDADGSRLMHMFFDYPPEQLEREIINRRVALDGWSIPDDRMSSVMRAAAELRSASSDGVLHTTWGVRHNIKVARALRWFQPVVAYRRAAGDALEPAQLEAVMTIVKSHFGDA